MSPSRAESLGSTLEQVGKSEQHENKRTNIFQKIYIVFANITVEPIVVLYLLPSMMGMIAIQNLNLEKACRVNLKFGEETCDAIASQNLSAYNFSYEIAMHQEIASMYSWKNFVQNLVPAFILLFLGSWTDRHNRCKPSMIVPILGDVVSVVGFILCTYFFYQLSMEWNAIAEAVPLSFSGGWYSLFMGVFTNITRITTEENRTLRIGMVTMIYSLSVTVGIAVSGLLYNVVGFYGVFGINLLVFIIGVLYGMFGIKEIPMDEVVVRRNDLNFVQDFFDWHHIADTFRVAFKKDNPKRNKKICFIMFLIMLLSGPIHGEFVVLFLFTRVKLNWSDVDFSLFMTIQLVLSAAATLILLILFTKVLKLNDGLIGLIATLGKIVSAFVYAFAPTTEIFYVGALFEMVYNLSLIAVRSLLSKAVPNDEIGKVNSLFGVAEAIVPLIYTPLYSLIYSLTMEIFPGAFFLVGAALNIPSVLLFIWFHFELKCEEKLPKQVDKDEEEVFIN